MSSEEQNNIIPFPGSNPGSKKSKERVLNQNENQDENQQEKQQEKQREKQKLYTNNRNQVSLKFKESPAHLLVEEENMKLKNSDVKKTNLINQTNSDFWRESVRSSKPHSLGKKYKNTDTSIEGTGTGTDTSTDTGTDTGTDRAGADRAGAGRGSSPPLPSKKPHLAVAGGVLALCLMLVSVPFLNQKNARGLASPLNSALPVKISKPNGKQYRVNLFENENGDLKVNLSEDLSPKRGPNNIEKGSFLETVKSVFGFSNRDPDNADKEKFNKILRRQQNKALHLISTGQRKLASIGRDPQARDIFFIEALNSSYNVKWRRGKLVHAVLLHGKTPVLLPRMDQMVQKYKEIFPVHRMLRKLDSLSGDLEIYELRDKEGLVTAQVETLRDEKGRVLSIYVQ